MMMEPGKSGIGSIESHAGKIAVGGGWRGFVATRYRDGESLSMEEWRRVLEDVDGLVDGGAKVLKKGSLVDVVCGELEIGGIKRKVVIKRMLPENGLRGFCRSLLRGKAVRNFRTAMRLVRYGIPTAYPLAGIERRVAGSSRENIFIAEYIPESTNLYNYFHDECGRVSQDAGLKANIGKQVGQILAQMHKGGLWHRDAKGGNFLVEGKGRSRPRVLLVDMDGIKRYGPRRGECRWRPFVKLGATLMASPAIYVSDYLRSFRIYCNLTGVGRDEMQRRFRRISREATGVRLLTAAKAAMKQAREDK
ncbi:3-deoxy-D-manno-octulosonic-acid kinase [Anaerohalosphaera lusitana]|uniref:3-deoxy-D-manno-octulosonic-acid kinase n=1 Tax=Anaerohalosphaera lusitana TaxID=1936003 RepID=A0A1U9NJ90_9BACT|nr:lipopolysaccharide kinase InaA family protein [Anaerohalosphaera lusitana]AQT68002.1 3-deoxy-D-manno-octulosonic-acid kinase [Anaerohalosphaera lusitana]